MNVAIDLTDYVKNTDYATNNKGGVIKTGHALDLNSSGSAQCGLRSYAQYGNADDGLFIGKGTLENVITGKGLVSNTNYASYSTGGVIKVNSSLGVYTTNGFLTGTTRTNEQYTSDNASLIISKGTLDNVLTATIGNIQTLLDNLDSGGGVE